MNHMKLDLVRINRVTELIKGKINQWKYLKLFNMLFQGLQLEYRSDTGLDQKIKGMNMNEVILKPHGRSMWQQCEQSLSTHQINETKMMVAKVALAKAINNNYLDICTINKVIDLLGARRSGDAYKILSTLHCVHYEDMPMELRERIPLLINEILTIPTNTSDVVDQMLRNVTIN